MSNDPWKHRSSGMRCATCMWQAESDTGKVDKDGKPIIKRRCRRHCPTMNGYPVIYADDWCGDHKVDEIKANQ